MSASHKIARAAPFFARIYEFAIDRPKLKTGIRILSETVRADALESDIGTQLGEIAKANPGVAIGSHPFFDPQHGPNTNVVLRASDAQKLQRAKRGGGHAAGAE
jgi:hypothetical protein